MVVRSFPLPAEYAGEYEEAGAEDGVLQDGFDYPAPDSSLSYDDHDEAAHSTDADAGVCHECEDTVADVGGYTVISEEDHEPDTEELALFKLEMEALALQEAAEAIAAGGAGAGAAAADEAARTWKGQAEKRLRTAQAQAGLSDEATREKLQQLEAMYEEQVRGLEDITQQLRSLEDGVGSQRSRLGYDDDAEAHDGPGSPDHDVGRAEAGSGSGGECAGGACAAQGEQPGETATRSSGQESKNGLAPADAEASAGTTCYGGEQLGCVAAKPSGAEAAQGSAEQQGFAAVGGGVAAGLEGAGAAAGQLGSTVEAGDAATMAAGGGSADGGLAAAAVPQGSAAQEGQMAAAAAAEGADGHASSDSDSSGAAREGEDTVVWLHDPSHREVHVFMERQPDAAAQQAQHAKGGDGHAYGGSTTDTAHQELSGSTVEAMAAAAGRAGEGAAAAEAVAGSAEGGGAVDAEQAGNPAAEGQAAEGQAGDGQEVEGAAKAAGAAQGGEVAAPPRRSLLGGLSVADVDKR